MSRIACCQIDPAIADLAANTELIATEIREAVGAGADIVVLPELATSGYMLADADEARAVALTPASPQFEVWAHAVGDSVAVFGFCEAVGLPTTLAEIGLGEVTEAELMRVADAACATGETIHNEPHEISPMVVAGALKTADAEGRRRKEAARAGKPSASAESSRWHLMVA